MRAPLRHNYKKKQQRTIRIAVIALVIIGVGVLLPKTVSLLSALVMTPVHAISVWLDESSSLVPSFIRDRQVLHEEIKGLEQELAVAKRSNLTQERLWQENNRLRALLGIAGEERTAAAVIARPNELPYDLLQIDRGSDHGIEVGAPVFVGRDVVIGLVVHTAPQYSFVELITTPGFEATAFIAGPNVVVTMEGVGGGVARVRVPQGIPLHSGDLVYLPSVEPGVYGRISHVENEPTQPEQYGYISPDIPVASLYQVAVGKQSQVTRSVEEIDQRVLELTQEQMSVSEAVTVGATTTATSTATISESQ